MRRCFGKLEVKAGALQSSDRGGQKKNSAPQGCREACWVNTDRFARAQRRAPHRLLTRSRVGEDSFVTCPDRLGQSNGSNVQDPKAVEIQNSELEVT